MGGTRGKVGICRMVAVGIGRGVSVGGIGVGVAVGIAAMVCAAIVHAIDMAVDCMSATLNVGEAGVFGPQALIRRLTTSISNNRRFIYPLNIIELTIMINYLDTEPR